MYKKLGRFATTYPWWICAAWASLGLLLALIAPNWDNNSQDDDIRFLPERCASVRGYHMLEKAFPQDVFASRLIFALERPQAKLTSADYQLVDAMVEDLKKLKDEEPALGINKVAYYHDPFVGKRLISVDGQCTLISVALASPYLALQTRTSVERASQVVRAHLEEASSDPPALFVTGPAGIGHDLVEATATSLDKTTLATVVLVVVILLLVYRAPLLALVPLLTIAGSIVVALKLLALCTKIPGFHLMNISQVFAVVMLYGAGTDYCLFLISRYREELTEGHDPETALERSVKSVGGALVASAGTVICGLGLMVMAEFAKVRCGGPAIAISLVVALCASLTLAPALLKIFGPMVFWPLGTPRKVRRIRRDLWAWLSDHVMARPMLVWGLSVLVLLPLALVGFQVKPTYKATSELAAASSSVAGLHRIQAHFPAGEIGPVTVLLESAVDWNTREGRAVIHHLSKGFGFLDNVVEVRSLTQPLGEPIPETPTPLPIPGESRQRGFQGMWQSVVKGVNAHVNNGMREFYHAQVRNSKGLTRYVTRLDVVLATDPFDPRSLPTVEVIQLWLRERLPETAQAMGKVRTETYGVTVNAKDLAEITESDRMRINTLVMGAIFLILLVLVRKPWLAGYLLVTVLFSYFATLGATTLVAHLYSGRPLGEVDWRVPFFLFTILVAVGEDYNILLVTRALKERRRHGALEGMRRALSHTGGTITSCGVIMAGTFATLMLAGLNTLVQIGFALAFGVLLDTFVVRPFLVPALMVFVWKQQEDSPAPAPPSKLRQRELLAVARIRRVA
jgi:putative drug exporter of the RND superfamily